MASEKLFKVAGTATHKGVTKVRYGNDIVVRVKALTRIGATDINLVELPKAMTKLEALRYLHDTGVTQGEAGYAVTSKLTEKSRQARRNELTDDATA